MGLLGRRDPAGNAGRRGRFSEGGFGDLYTRKVLDLTIRLAEVMLSSGSGTADVVATARDVAQAYRIDDCVIDVTFTTITVSTLPSAETPPVTIVRSVHARSTDYTRLNNLDRLVRRITAGGVSVDQAHEAMDELAEASHPYPRWLATVGWAGFALGIAMLMGGTWFTAVIAALTAAVLDRIGRVLNRIGTPFFFQHAVGAMIATLIALAAYQVTGQGLTTLVATGIVLLLSGMAWVASFQDAMTGYMVTATARLGDVIFLTSGIVVGILGALQLADLLGMQGRLSSAAPTPMAAPDEPARVLLMVLGAAIAASCLMLASYAPMRALIPAGLAAALAELLWIGLTVLGFGPVTAAGAAAAGVGFAATLVSLRRRAPALLIATAGITPMLPGLAVFHAVFAFAVDASFGVGFGQLLRAAATGLALGSGVVLGEFLASPLRTGAGRVGDWLRLDGPPGLRRAIGRVVRLRPAPTAPAAGPVVAPRTGSVPLVPEEEESDEEVQETETEPSEDDSVS